MSLYNMLFGMNSQSDLLLAVIGLRKPDVERFRDVFVSEDGSGIIVHTRTGGGNRESYPNVKLRHSPGWVRSVDDEGDCTYCNDMFAVPEEWRGDVANLGDVLTHGLRPEFAAFLSKTLRREPSESDRKAATRDAESSALARTQHSMANGHTFVPHDDVAMETALRLAESSGGELLSCLGFLPLRLKVVRDVQEYGGFTRARIDYDWVIDAPYWEHVQTKFAAKYPKAMGKLCEHVERQREIERKEA